MTRPTPSVVADEELVERVAKAIEQPFLPHGYELKPHLLKVAARAALAASDRDVLVGRIERLEIELVIARQLAYAAGRDDLVAAFDDALVPLGEGWSSAVTLDSPHESSI